ncbi:MAG TPA: hypothetical protein EYN67_00790 [Flavobacteriales bacterium]|nr:hypothetical protein [Flavobacteriales bacterium]
MRPTTIDKTLAEKKVGMLWCDHGKHEFSDYASFEIDESISPNHIICFECSRVIANEEVMPKRTKDIALSEELWIPVEEVDEALAFFYEENPNHSREYEEADWDSSCIEVAMEQDLDVCNLVSNETVIYYRDMGNGGGLTEDEMVEKIVEHLEFDIKRPPHTVDLVSMEIGAESEIVSADKYAIVTITCSLDKDLKDFHTKLVQMVRERRSQL